MTVLIIGLVVMTSLFLWSAMATCSLAGFVSGASVVSQLAGPGAHADFTAALAALAGVRVLERTDDAVLVSVMPVPSSMERGFGLFAVAQRVEDDGVMLLGRGRLPVALGLETALRQLERDARMQVSYGPRSGSE
ncbi:hypothetical protein [Amycolatopsis circi]|uniref:hypothetical protein n=1 Tax=Amycolatopsis circi TaxID=871959 RepID=UPI000E26CD7A|nr:hypothetical protein [Amycolatopsis circi]